MADLILGVCLIGIALSDLKVKIVLDSRCYTYDNTRVWKGILALIVLLHHISLRLQSCVFCYFGVIAVDGFLILSGYGMMKQFLETGTEYTKKLIRNKIPNTLIFMGLTILISFCFYGLLGNIPTATDIIGSLKGNMLLNWYFTTYLLLELILLISISLFSKSRMMVLTYSIILSLIVFLFLFLVGGVKSNSIESLPAFWIGLIIAYVEQLKEKERLKDFFMVINKIPLFVLLIISFLLFVGSNYLKWNTIFKIGCVALLAIGISLIIMRISPISKCAFSEIGKLSGEMLAIQTISPVILENIAKDYPFLYIFGTIGIHIILLLILSPIYRKVRITK